MKSVRGIIALRDQISSARRALHRIAACSIGEQSRFFFCRPRDGAHRPMSSCNAPPLQKAVNVYLALKSALFRGTWPSAILVAAAESLQRRGNRRAEYRACQISPVVHR